MKKYYKWIACVQAVLAVFLLFHIFYLNQNLNKLRQEAENSGIHFKIDGRRFSLSDIGYYPIKSEYEETFWQLDNLYHLIASEKSTLKANISYFLHIDVVVKEKVFSNYIYGCEQPLDKSYIVMKEGRYFSESELNNGSFSAIIDENMSHEDGTPVEIGEEIELKTSFSRQSVKVEIIGKYAYQKEAEKLFENRNGSIIMPNRTILNISEEWFAESEEKYKNDPRYLFLPAGIENPVFEFENEHDYDLIKAFAMACMDQTKADYHIVRLEKTSEVNQVNVIHGENELRYSVFALILWSIGIVFFWIAAAKLKSMKEKQFRQMIAEQQNRYAQNMIQVNEETHKLKHDMKHFLNHLCLMLETHEYECAIKLLKEYQTDIDTLNLLAYTNHKTINVILNHYLERAKLEQADFTYSINLTNEPKLSERKFYILLSNALDNAFTHGTEPKTVRLNIDQLQQYVRIRIMNLTQLHDLSELKIDRKQDHGFGIKSMKQIVKEADGEIFFDIQNGWLSVSVLLPYSDEKQPNAPKV